MKYCRQNWTINSNNYPVVNRTIKGYKVYNLNRI